MTSAAGIGELVQAGGELEVSASHTPGGGQISTLNPAASTWTVLSDIIKWTNQKKIREENKRQFDKTFAENQRQFGLEYALKEFSTRKQLDLQEVRDMWNVNLQSGQLDLQRANTRQALQTASQQQQQQEKQFDWLESDREKAERAANAYSRGIIKGFTGVT